jgi:hypothetical protein
LSASVRLDVTPRNAEVFVDGYSAGVVDDFDGVFQRLRLRPGEHTIVVYLPGHRTVRHDLYLNPGSDQKIRHEMEPLAPGETAELPPPPAPRRDDRDRPPPRQRPIPDPGRVARPEREAFGTLSLRVEPDTAEIFVDGERWNAPAGQEAFSIRLPEGRHRIEIRKEGFARYVEEILIRTNRTLTLNVSLKRGGG